MKRAVVNGIGKIGKEVALQKRFKRVIGCITDIHAGSWYSVFPDGFKLTKAGNTVTLNPGQISLLESFHTFKKVLDSLNCDTVFVVGDIVHGQNIKERGMNLITTDLGQQKKAAGVLLSPILKGRKSYWVAGSGYHSSTPGHNPDEGLCETFNEKENYSSTWLGQVANLKVGRRIINLSHGGGGAFIYRETAMAREIVFAKMAMANGKLPKIDMFIHGHFHWFSYLHEYDTHYLQLPCWIAFEPAPIFTKNYTRYQPDIGGAVVMIDHEDRITVWHFLYPLPHIADETIEI